MSSVEAGRGYINSAANAIIGQRRHFAGGGFVKLDQYMGGDFTILRIIRSENMATWGDTRSAASKIDWLLRTRAPVFKEVVIRFEIGIRPNSELEFLMAKEAVRFSIVKDAEENEYLWTVNLNGLTHFLPPRLKDDNTTIRAFAETVAGITKTVAPLFYQAFENQVLGAVSFSLIEQGFIRRIMLRGEPVGRVLDSAGLIGHSQNGGTPEFLLKLGRMLNLNPDREKVTLEKVEAALVEYRQKQ